MKFLVPRIGFYLGVLALPHGLARADTYVTDPAHSSIGFSVRNVLVRVSGKFTAFTANLEFDAGSPERSTVSATITIASIDTGEPKRDHHLQQPEFFDAAKFPEMTFHSTGWKQTAPDEFQVTGNLAIRGVTKPAVLKVRKFPAAGATTRWEATTRLNRHDFGVSAYRNIIGSDVDVIISLQLTRHP